MIAEFVKDNNAEFVHFQQLCQTLKDEVRSLSMKLEEEKTKQMELEHIVLSWRKERRCFDTTNFSSGLPNQMIDRIDDDELMNSGLRRGGHGYKSLIRSYLNKDKLNGVDLHLSSSQLSGMESILMKKLHNTTLTRGGWRTTEMKQCSMGHLTPFKLSLDRINNDLTHFLPLNGQQISHEWMFLNVSIEPLFSNNWASINNNGGFGLVRQKMEEGAR